MFTDILLWNRKCNEAVNTASLCEKKNLLYGGKIQEDEFMSEKKTTLGESGIYDAKTLGAPKVAVLGLQHMFAMFGATILVPILTGLDVSTTLLFAGLGTLLFHLITGGIVPAFLGS